ncbi:lipid A-modifier LpxR family protein [Shimia biformata]|uniref:lipid A-modifier LpxR family protein n=1 Tax=Shimia biformata TaxID=1294299 RepID=UPI00195110B1|nr:lipid A-modifier LpxR family protein [Shimia biformata]
MLGRIASVFLVLLCFAGAVSAQDRQNIGYGRLITNDLIGDGHDRWRTGAIVSSRVRGYDWTGGLPTTPGELIELRWRAEIISPANLSAFDPTDRRYAGTLGFGAFTHWDAAGFDFKLGAELALIGPMTRLDDFQVFVHETFGMVPPSDAVVANQIGNRVMGNAEFEVGRNVFLGDSVTLRPFVSGAVGPEDMLRAGVDLIVGKVGRGELMLRDPVTGHHYRAIRSGAEGFSLVLGADVAKVFDSVYLPESQGYQLTDNRPRVRAGLFWQGEKSSVFYGASWLGEEFEGQADSQIVGAIRLNLHF